MICALQHKKRSQKSGRWIGSSSMLSRELSSFLGSSTNGRGNTLESASHLLFSPILSSVSLSDQDGSQEDEFSNKSASVTSPLKSTEISLLDGANELDYEERRQRTAFVQQLIASTIF
uniref:Di19 C-terminal domain-containing protein n=1 Tax=Rhizophora mucronata TaxID=61149 RepID=A0A2P2M8F5_RHIMU